MNKQALRIRSKSIFEKTKYVYKINSKSIRIFKNSRANIHITTFFSKSANCKLQLDWHIFYITGVYKLRFELQKTKKYLKKQMLIDNLQSGFI